MNYNMAKGRYFSRKKVSGMQRVIRGLVSLVTLWVLMYAFEKILNVVDDYVTNTGQFGQAIDLLKNLPQILGILASIFLIMDVVQGFRQMRA